MVDCTVIHKWSTSAEIDNYDPRDDHETIDNEQLITSSIGISPSTPKIYIPTISISQTRCSQHLFLRYQYSQFGARSVRRVSIVREGELEFVESRLDGIHPP